MSESVPKDAGQSIEIRRVRRLLKEMYSLAETSSLTGAFSGATHDLVERHNRILKHLASLGADPGPLFDSLPAEATLDQVGAACKLLAGYLREDEGEVGHDKAGPNIVIGQLGGIEGLDDLRNIGQTIRESLADLGMPRRPDQPPLRTQPAAEEESIPMPEVTRTAS